MRVGRLRKMGRSFCCTRKCQKGRKWRESQSKGGNLLNTDIVPGYISCSYSFCEQHGWYRIAETKGVYSSNSCVISLKRFYNNMPPEYQKIQFFGVYTLRKFISISSASLMHAWTKIRETCECILPGDLSKC